LDFDYQYNWKDLNSDALEDIMKKLESYQLWWDIGDSEQEFSLTKDNMEISPNKDDIWIKTPIGGVLSVENILWKKSDQCDTNHGRVTFSDYEMWDGIRRELNNAYAMAQAMADESDAWDVVTGAIVDKMGKGKPKRINDQIYIELDLDYISQIFEYELSTGDSSDITSMLTVINDVGYSDNSDLLIECDPPYNGWSGTIDSDTLSSEVINRLDDVYI